MNTTDIDRTIKDAIAPIQSPEFAEAIGHAIVARLISTHETSTEPDSHLRALLPLLQEYTLKLQEYMRNAGPLQAWRPDRGGGGLNQFLPAARKLAQFVSQRLNRAQNDLLRLELELRLAEYETALSNAQRN